MCCRIPHQGSEDEITDRFTHLLTLNTCFAKKQSAYNQYGQLKGLSCQHSENIQVCWDKHNSHSSWQLIEKLQIKKEKSHPQHRPANARLILYGGVGKVFRCHKTLICYKGSHLKSMLGSTPPKSSRLMLSVILQRKRSYHEVMHYLHTRWNMLSSAQQNSDARDHSLHISFSRCFCFITVFQEIVISAQGIIESLLILLML